MRIQEVPLVTVDGFVVYSEKIELPCEACQWRGKECCWDEWGDPCCIAVGREIPMLNITQRKILGDIIEMSGVNVPREKINKRIREARDRRERVYNEQRKKYYGWFDKRWQL